MLRLQQMLDSQFPLGGSHIPGESRPIRTWGWTFKDWNCCCETWWQQGEANLICPPQPSPTVQLVTLTLWSSWLLRWTR